MLRLSNWRAVLRDAWSVRLLYLLMLINGLEAMLWAFAEVGGPVWLRSLASLSIAALATWARIILQPKLERSS